MNRVTPTYDGSFFDGGLRRALRSPTYSVCYVSRKYMFRRALPSENSAIAECESICAPEPLYGLCPIDGILHRQYEPIPELSAPELKKHREGAATSNRIGIRNIFFAALYSVFAVCLLYATVNYISSESDIGFSRIVIPNSSEAPASNDAFALYRDSTYVNLECKVLGIERTVAAPVTTAREFVMGLDYGFDDDDILSCSDDTVVSAGMTISVDLVSVETVESEASVPFRTETTLSQTIPKGEIVVTREGRDGRCINTIKNTYVNGELSGSEIISTTVTLEPVSRLADEGSGGTITVGGRVYSYSYYRDVEATAYGGSLFAGGTTSTGKEVRDGMIAVDPDVIALGSSVYIVGENGYSRFNGFYKAEDTGGSIIGDRIDVYTGSDITVATAFGRRAMRVYVFD